MTEKNQMTERERVETLLQRGTPDRIPIIPFAPHGFAAIYAGLTITDAYTNPEAVFSAQLKTCEDFGWVNFPSMGYASFGAWEFGGEIKMPEGRFDQAPTIVRNPIETEDDGWNLTPPEGPSGFMPTSDRFTRLCREAGLADNMPFNTSVPGSGVFTTATNLAGVDRFLKWMITKPDLAHHILRVLADWKLSRLPLLKERFGFEGVMPRGGEATATNQLISAKHFKEFVLPYFKEGQEKILEMGYTSTWCHLCGDQNLNLPYWSEVPFGDPGIISLGHEMDLEKAAEYFPDQILMGNLDPAIVQIGTPTDVYMETKKVVEKGKKLPCGYIFSLGCDIPPYAPVENIRMITKAVNDFGWYD